MVEDKNYGMNCTMIGLISMAGNSGTQMGGWFLKKIDSINDFKGLKMRILDSCEVLNRIGGTAVALPGGEIMPALQSGAIDATE